MHVVISMAPAVRSPSHVVIIIIIIIIVAIAVTIKHGTFFIIRGHINKSSHNCEAPTVEFFVRQVPFLLNMASLRHEIFKLNVELCYDFKYLGKT